jgi:hypothetical protein
MCMGDNMKRNQDESRRIPINEPTTKSKNPQNRKPPYHPVPCILASSLVIESLGL